MRISWDVYSSFIFVVIFQVVLVYAFGKDPLKSFPQPLNTGLNHGHAEELNNSTSACTAS